MAGCTGFQPPASADLGRVRAGYCSLQLHRDRAETCRKKCAKKKDLFAILVGLCQSGEIPAMAMLVPDRNGFELRRRMHARFEPENKHKPYAWLRALSNPVFPEQGITVAARP